MGTAAAETLPGLTPTEDLLLEVLIARHRLGERLWTFEARHRKAIGSLADKGLVASMHGIVEHTVRASLTPAAIKAYVSPKYVPPILRQPTEGGDAAETVVRHEWVPTIKGGWAPLAAPSQFRPESRGPDTEILHRTVTTTTTRWRREDTSTL